MIAIIQFLIITVIAAAFARRILSRYEPDFVSPGERLIFEAAIGLGFLALIIFALGVAQLFYPLVLVGLLLVMAGVSWKALGQLICEALASLRSAVRQPKTLEVSALFVVLTALALLALIRALAPPVADDWDGLAYHLAIPKLYLEAHGVHFVPFSSHSNFPFVWEMLFTLGLAMKSIALAKLFHYGAAILLVAATASLGNRHFSRSAGRLAALFVAGVPLVVWESTAAYVDLATALYSLLTVYALMNYSATKDRRWAVFAGIVAGLAAGTKMTALIMIAVAGFWILLDRSREKPSTPFKTAVVAALVATVIALPWYAKSYINTGNPVYPFAYELFGGTNWSAETAELYRSDQLKFGLGQDSASFLLLPWNLTFRHARFDDYGARLPQDFPELPLFSGNPQVYMASLGPLVLLVLPVMLIGIIRPGRHRTLILVAGFLTLVWFFAMQNTRYFLPTIAVLAPASAYCAEVLRVRKAVFTLALLTAAFTAFVSFAVVCPAAKVAFGLQTPADYLTRFGLYNACSYINNELPKDAKIALFGETRGFYLDRPYFWADPGHNAIIPYGDFEDNPELLVDWLSEHSCNYVLVNYQNYPRNDDTIIAHLVGHGLTEVYSSDSGIYIYRVDSVFR